MSPEWDNKWKLFNTKIRPALIVSDHCDTVSIPWETQRQNQVSICQTVLKVLNKCIELNE